MKEKKIFGNDPKKWIEAGGKGRLIPDGGMKKSVKKAQKKFEQMQRDMMQEAIYEKLHKPEATPPKGLNYFTWHGSKDQLEALWQALKGAGFINPETDFKAFRAIFSGSAIGTDLHRVTWIKRSRRSKSIAKNAVISLFDLLANYNKIPVDETRNRAELFRKLEACFCDETGKPLPFTHKNCTDSEYSDQLRQIISSL